MNIPESLSESHTPEGTNHPKRSGASSPPLSSSLPYGTLTATPVYRHQLEGVEYIVNRKWSALRDQCGLGKTIQAIYAGRELLAAGEIDKIVVVCKSDLVSNWEEELAIHAAPLSVRSLHGKPPAKRVWSSSTDIHIINFDLFGRGPDKKMKPVKAVDCMGGGYFTMGSDALKFRKFLQENRCFLVLDESQKIKSPTAKVTKTLCSLAGLATRRLILTATLQAETPMDVWSQMFFLDGGQLLGSLSSFKRRYTIWGTIKVGWGRKSKIVPKIVGFKNIPELHKKLEMNSILRTKSDCLDLPPKFVKERTVIPSVDQNGELLKLRNKLLHMLSVSNSSHVSTVPSSSFGEMFHKLSRLSSMPQTVDSNCGVGAKFKALLSICDEVDGQILVSTTHRDVATFVHASLCREGITASLVLGGQKEITKESIKNFKSGNSRVLVGVDLVLREGHNFQHSSHCVLFEHSFSLLTRVQLEDRQHRIGQTETVIIEKLIMPCSLDRYILSLVDAKEGAVSDSVEDGVISLKRESIIRALEQMT